MRFYVLWSNVWKYKGQNKRSRMKNKIKRKFEMRFYVLWSNVWKYKVRMYLQKFLCYALKMVVNHMTGIGMCFMNHILYVCIECSE